MVGAVLWLGVLLFVVGREARRGKRSITLLLSRTPSPLAVSPRDRASGPSPQEVPPGCRFERAATHQPYKGEIMDKVRPVHSYPKQFPPMDSAFRPSRRPRPSPLPQFLQRCASCGPTFSDAEPSHISRVPKILPARKERAREFLGQGREEHERGRARRLRVRRRLAATLSLSPQLKPPEYGLQ